VVVDDGLVELGGDVGHEELIFNHRLHR
jgi:hypothetical protein